MDLDEKFSMAAFTIYEPRRWPVIPVFPILLSIPKPPQWFILDELNPVEPHSIYNIIDVLEPSIHHDIQAQLKDDFDIIFLPWLS